MPVMNILAVVLGLGVLARCHARVLRVPRALAPAPLEKSGDASPSGQQMEEAEAAPIRLFCFAFFPRRPGDDEKLPEARLQLQRCDGYLFFTDEEAPGEPVSNDIVRVKVPRQAVARSHPDWLKMKNMAGITPAWTYLLKQGRLENFDWVLNVELDHFTRPSKVRSAIRETLKTLRQGSEWERSFFKAPNGTSGSSSSADGAAAKPLLLAFGNAFAFSKAMVTEMRRNWPLPGLATDAGCPSGVTWLHAGLKHVHCEQDMVYPIMGSHFRPAVQLFGTPGCGKKQKTENGIVLPFTCWEFYQNPYGEGPEHQTEESQIRAIHAIANGSGRVPSGFDRPTQHIFPRLVNMTDAEAEANGTRAEGLPRPRDLLSVEWEEFFPPRDIPLIHHVLSSKVLREARMQLGL